MSAEQPLRDLAAERGQLVVDARRVRRLRLAVDEAVALQRVQGLGEHLLAHAVDPAAQLVEAARASCSAPRVRLPQRPVTCSSVSAGRAGAGEHVEGESPSVRLGGFGAGSGSP